MNVTNEFPLLPGERAVDAGASVKVIDNGKGLAWGTDAYLLAAFLRRHRRACELGAGCGVVSFLCAAHAKADTVTAFECNADAADRAARGALLNGLSDKVRVLRRDIRDVRPDDADCGGRFDCVFANPPYIAHPGLAGTDAVAQDARHENNGTVADFCAAAARLLRQRGSFSVVWRPERLTDLLCALRACRLEPKRAVFVYADTASRPFLVLCEAVLGASPGLSFSPPLIFYRDTKEISPRVMTDTAAKIYADCSFDCLIKP